MTDGPEFKDIATKAWSNAIEDAVSNVLRRAAGYGIESEIKNAIRAQAIKEIETNAEIKGMILDALRSWITTQTADDFRKSREENIKRFGNHR